MALRVEQKASGLTFEVRHGCLVSGLILLVSAGTRDLDRAFAVEQHPALVATSLTSDQERALRPGDDFRECPSCPVMVVLPIGSFTMGAPDDLMISGPDMWGVYPNERPAHLVTISYPLAIGKYEITFTEWEACVAADGCDQIADDGGFGRGERPAVNISWDDANRYLDWLSKLTGKTYRLPSEAEWNTPRGRS